MKLTHTVYSFGGGEELWYDFNAIAALFKDGGYTMVFYICAMMFGIWVLIHSIVKGNSAIPFKWMFWVWVVLEVILVPKTTVLIKDPVTQYERHVDDVPYILGSFASIMSGMSYGITDRVETFFSLPEYQKYSEKGPMFASKIMKSMGKFRIREGNLKENMTRFIHECVILESLSGGKYTVDDLRRSNDIWNLVKTNAHPIYGFSYRGKDGTEILTCKEGAKLIDEDLKEQVGKVSTYMGRKLKLDAKNNASEQVFANFFKTELTDSFQFMSGIAADAEKVLKQEMLINAIEDARTSYAVAKATTQQREWNLTTGEMASTMLLTMKIVLETLAYSAFIFVAIMMMLPGGLNVFSKYLGILIWLQLWAPLYAVLNMVLSIAARYKTQAAMAGDGLTMLNSIGITTLHADIEAVAAMCSASIPFISYALLQGGVGAFMHLAGTMTNAMSGSAQSASNEITSGNLSMNTVSLGNRQYAIQNSLKHDDNLSYRSGRMEMETMSGAQQFQTGDGRLNVVAGQGYTTSRLPDMATINSNINNAINQGISSEESMAASYGKSYEKHKSMATDTSQQILAAATRGTGQNRCYTISEGSRYADSLNKTMQFTKNLAENHGYTSAQASEIAMSLGGRLGFLSGKSNFSSQEAYNEAVQKGRSIADSQGVTNHLEIGTNRMEDVRFNESMGEEKRLSESLQISKSEMERSQISASQHRSSADRLKDARDKATTFGVGVNQDATEKFIDYVADQQLGHQTHKLCRAGALKLLSDPERPHEYAGMVDRFVKSQDKQGLATKGDAFNNINKSNINPNKDNVNPFKDNYQKNVEHNKKAFTLETAGKKGDGKNEDIPGNYGAFNQLTARGEEEEVINDYVDDKKKEIKEGEVAVKNNLEINKDLNSNKAQEKYRTYETREDEKVDIVNTVRDENEKSKGLINQQTDAVDAKRQDLQTKYDKEESVPGPVKAVTGAVGAVVGNIAKTAGAIGQDGIKNDILKAKNKGSNLLYDTFSNNKEASNLTTQNTEAKYEENLSIGKNTSNANESNVKTGTVKPLTSSSEPSDNQNISQNNNTNQAVVNNTTASKEGNNRIFVDLSANHPKSLSPKTLAEENQDKKNKVDAKAAMQNSSFKEENKPNQQADKEADRMKKLQE
jgi:conjugal transfer mating pair stabilization protein TraG